jgi:hypothetical protein
MSRGVLAMTNDGLSPNEEHRRHQRARSIAIAIVLAGLVALFYFVTIVKLGPGIIDRPL